MKKNILFVLCFLFLISLEVSGQNQTEIVCNSVEKVGGKTVVIGCEDGSKISLEFLDSKNIKFWFSPDGSFTRNNESFAVINEDFDPGYKIDVQENSSNFEVFTGDLRVMVHKNPLKIQIFDKYQRLVLGDDDAQAYLTEGNEVETRKVLRDDEQFFGLGEKTGSLNRRGRSFKMWNSDKPCYSDTEDPLYKSIPFFLSSYNYGIFFDNTYKTEFDFGESSDDYYSFSAPDGPFIYYFMYGNGYKEIIQNYVRLTGKPIMPPKWGLGWSQSRGMLVNEELTREIADQYRKREIPIDIIYQDIGWVDGLQNFDWREDRYENPEKMLSDLEADGFKVIVSQDPVISQATQEQWQEANEKGFLVQDTRTGKAYDMPWPWGGNAGVVDFSNPKVSDWWGKLQQKPLEAGVKGFWTDMGEPAWSNEESTDRLNMKHYLGMHDEIHNVYGFLWDKVVTEQFEKRNPNQRVFQMTRAAYAGMQRYTFGWSGDSGNGRDVTDGWENLADQIPMGLSAGMGLIPFWTTDISGYCGDITDYDAFAELYVRWLQFGVFNPLSRAHHEGNNAVEPWLFGEEAERISKEAIELKYQLHPYFYTYARQAYDTGLPIMRALLLEYPGDEETYELDGQFLLGEELLVAPVVEEGARTKKVYLPKGQWRDYNNPQKSFSGGEYVQYDAPLDVIPMFVKEGAILPKMPVMPYIGAMKNAPVILEVYPSERNSEFILYEDQGTTNDYKKGEFAKTLVESKPTSEKVELVIHAPEGPYQTEKRNFWVEVFLEEKPKKVILDGKKVKKYRLSRLKENWNLVFDESGFHYDQESKRLFVKLPDNKRTLKINIEK